METIRQYFSDFLSHIGSHNFLAVGIVIIVAWLLISGLRKGLRKASRNNDSEENNEDNNRD
jgi:SNF family Na+-dependent transporter